MESYPIHIAFCINDAYAKYVCVTIKSIVDNHPNDDVTIHILSDYISEKSKCRLSEALIGAESHISIAYHWMNDMDCEGLRVSRLWPICIWYRFALCNVLSKDIHRVLYLDADTVVAANLSHLFQMNMENKSIAAVFDINCVINEKRPSYLGYDESKGYSCSGVILMNLDYWRQNNLLNTLIDWAKEHHDLITFPDQDAMNVVCLDSKIDLPWNYDITYHSLTMDEAYELYLNDVKLCIDNPVIIHCTAKPWFRETSKKHPQYKIWRHYNRRLRHPVRITYIAEGLIPLKMFIWNMLHPSVRNSRMTISKIKKRIKKAL
jgi:lipopolysaccharide biosynthesis glycosyltransferase